MRKAIFVILILSGFIATGCAGRSKGSEDKVFNDTATGLSWQVSDFP